MKPFCPGAYLLKKLHIKPDIFLLLKFKLYICYFTNILKFKNVILIKKTACL